MPWDRSPTDPPGAGPSTRLTSTRRRFLRAGSLTCGALLAGCTADVGEELPPNRKRTTSEYAPELPVVERTSILAERIRQGADAEVETLDDMAAILEEYALDVEDVARERDVVTLEYVATERYREGTLHHVGLVAGAYASLVAAGVDAVAVDVTILDDAPATFGAAAVETRWAERFNDGTLSAKEYGELVADTIESKRDDPDVDVEPSE